MFARAFAKKLDQSIKVSPTFKSWSPEMQFIIAGLLNFMHHLWIGLLIMLTYAQNYTYLIYVPGGVLPIAPFWFGYGLFIDDMPDVPNRFKKYFEYLKV
jgi:hypothetical protein